MKKAIPEKIKYKKLLYDSQKNVIGHAIYSGGQKIETIFYGEKIK